MLAFEDFVNVVSFMFLTSMNLPDTNLTVYFALHYTATHVQLTQQSSPTYPKIWIYS